MKFAASTSLKRTGAVVAIGAALLSATACGPVALDQQPTTIVYSASDGVMADLGDVKLRNIMVISSGENDPGRLLGTILNTGDSSATVTLKFDSGDETLTIAAGQEVRFEDSANQLIVTPTGANPGMMLMGTEVTSGSETASMDIPVLDGTLDEYEPYLPKAASASATSTASASESAGTN